MTSVPDELVVYGLYCTCHPGQVIRYIGQTIHGAEWRLRIHRSQTSGGRSPLGKWMHKHGRWNIRSIVLATASDVEELDRLEFHYIACYRVLSAKPMLNLKDGGQGGGRGLKWTDEMKRAMSEKKRGRRPSDETKSKRRETVVSMGVVKGSNNPRAKIDEETAVMIYLDCVSRNGTLQEVADRYGVSNSIVQNIKYGKTWTHATGNVGR